MTSERSKRRDFFVLVFISKSISKKLLIKIHFIDKNKLWCCVGGRVKQKLGFIRRVDKGQITIVKD